MACELQDTLEAAVALIEADSVKFNNIVNGDDQTVVTTDNGPVSSAAKAIKDFVDRTDWGGNYIEATTSSGTTYAQGAFIINPADNNIYIVELDFESTDFASDIASGFIKLAIEIGPLVTAAAASAAAASTSESNAATSETNAATSETNAAASAAAAAVSAGSLANFAKNRLKGGDFATNPWQRGESFVSVADGSFTADRWQYNETGIAVSDVTKEAGESDGRSALRLEITTAMPSPGVNDKVNILQPIEGFDIVPLLASSAFSIRIRSNITGILPIAFVNAGGDRSFVGEVTIASANTWQDAEIVIPVIPSTGTWDYEDGIGLRVAIVMAAGTALETTPGSWQTGDFLSTSSAVNRAATIGNYVEIDRVQLEEGNIGHDFDSKNALEVLDDVERYFEIIDARSAFGGLCAVFVDTVDIYRGFFYYRTKKRTSSPSLVIRDAVGNNAGVSMRAAGSTTDAVSSNAVSNADGGRVNTDTGAFSPTTTGDGNSYQMIVRIESDAELF